MLLWHSQRSVMLAWLISSIVLLLLFAPFFITTGLFLGAEVACILCIMASSVYLCKRTAADGEYMHWQDSVPASCLASVAHLAIVSTQGAFRAESSGST
jgi:hypothetical protein